MPTARRLINKKAFEEMKLIRDFLGGDAEVSIRLTHDDNEEFVVKSEERNFEVVGENYTKISKMLLKLEEIKDGKVF